MGLVDQLRSALGQDPLGMTGQARQINLENRTYNTNGNRNILIPKDDLIGIPPMEHPQIDLIANPGYQRG